MIVGYAFAVVRTLYFLAVSVLLHKYRAAAAAAFGVDMYYALLRIHTLMLRYPYKYSIRLWCAPETEPGLLSSKI